ncbi:MAG: hypothetical protein QM714_06605 [Nocardioides sp.]|uniref:hypothetical protein n=1 Tax=Nocardioides sp. TaxID=35761 RepID=UPI0039E543C8
MEWQEYLQFEGSAINADADCRAQKYAQGLALLAPLLDEFEQNHQSELTNAENGWTELLAAANRQGIDDALTH